MTITVRLPAQLRPYADGNATLPIDGAATIGDVLAAVERGWPGVGRRVLDEQGTVRRHVHVYIGDEPMQTKQDAVADGAEVTILPAVSGG